MARRRETLAETAQEHLDAAREQAERDKRWQETMHSNERPADPAVERGAAATDELPPTDGEEIEDQTLRERGGGTAPASEPPIHSDYQDLVTHLAQARVIIWQRINRGHWATEDHAAAAMDAYQDLGKALKRLTPALVQLPLADPKEASDGALRGV